MRLKVELLKLSLVHPSRLQFLFSNIAHYGSDSKESICSVGDLGSVPGLGRFPGAGHGNPLQYSFLENPYGQRSLEGYSPWGHKELDMTEQLNTTQHHKSSLLE